MKRIFTILLLLMVVIAHGQSDIPSNYIRYPFTYGTRIDRTWADKALHVPRDTIYTKSGLAIKGSTLYYGDSTRWYAAGSGGGTNTLQQVFDLENAKAVMNKDDTVQISGNKFVFYHPSGGGAWLKLDFTEPWIGGVQLDMQNLSEGMFVAKGNDVGEVRNIVTNTYNLGASGAAAGMELSQATTFGDLNVRTDLASLGSGGTIAPNGALLITTGAMMKFATSDTGYFAWIRGRAIAPTVAFTEMMRLTKLGYLGIGLTAPTYRLHVDDSTKLSGVAFTRRDEFGGPTIATAEYLTIWNYGVNTQTRNLTQFQSVRPDVPNEIRLFGRSGESMANGTGVINGFNYDGPQANQPLYFITSGFNAITTHKGGSMYFIPGTNYASSGRDYTFPQYTGDSIVFKLNTDAAYRPYFYIRGRQHLTDSLKLDNIAYYTSNIHGKYSTHTLVDKDYVDSSIAAGGGSTPTLQQVLTAGSTLTGNNTIAGGGFDLTLNNVGSIDFNSTTSSQYKHSDGTAAYTRMYQSFNGGDNPVTKIEAVNAAATNISTITVQDDSVAINADGGIINFTALRSGYIDTTLFKPLARKASGDIVQMNSWAQVSGGGGGSGTVTSVSFTGGLISVATATTTPALTVAGTSGGVPYFSSTSTWASSALLAASALMIGGGAGTAPATTTTGTGVLTALGVNVGSAGAFVTFNGALGTPSSGTLTSATGLPISTGVSGLGTGVATFLATPSSANLLSALTDETGTGVSVFGTTPTFTTSIIDPLVVGSISANGTLTIEGNNTTGNTSTNANLVFKVGNSAATTAMQILNAGNVLIGAPTADANQALNIQSLTNTGSEGIRIFALNLTASMKLGYQTILTSGGMIIQASSTGVEIVGPSGTSGSVGSSAVAPTSTWSVNGSFGAQYVAKTANYTATATDFTIECTANTFQVTLPTAVGISGRIYYVVNSGAGTITIGTTSSQTFVNVTLTPTTLTMSTVGTTAVQSNGANWMRLSSLDFTLFVITVLLPTILFRRRRFLDDCYKCAV